MPDELIRAAVTILFGALAGGLTNTVAIWMLFHPYRPPRPLGRKLSFLQGAIPKNQARLAAAIGRTVGDRLLTAEDLARTFREPSFREAFDDRLAGFLDGFFDAERGSLREELPAPVVAELDALLREVLEAGMERLEEWLESPEFEEAVARRAEELADAVADRPLSGVLDEEREAALAAAVDDWIVEVVGSEGFEDAVRDYAERAADSLLVPERTFEEVLPTGLVEALERAIQAYLPLAIERLGRLLEDPQARRRFEGVIHDLLHRFLRDLRFHQRVVARLIITEETVDRVLDTVEEEGTERISEMLREPDMQEALARGVNDAVVDFLRRPVVAVVGRREDPGVTGAIDTLVGWAVELARAPETRSFVVEKIEATVERLGERTWGELFERVSPERISAWIVGAARSERASEIYAEASDRLVDGILDRSIGRPASLLPDDAASRVEAALSDPLWDWLQGQVPSVVERLDVAGRVEEKVLNYPMEKVESLIRGVTERELRLIVKLGYLLGAAIGTALVGVDLLMPGG